MAELFVDQLRLLDGRGRVRNLVGDGDSEPEVAPVPRGGFDLDAPAVSLDGASRDRKTEAGARLIRSTSTVGLEEIADVSLGDSRAVVPHVNDELLGANLGGDYPATI